MPLVKKDKWAPSQRPVAIDPVTFKAFQVGKKGGEITLTFGSYSKWCLPMGETEREFYYDPRDWEDFLRRVNTQQGGMRAKYKWNGKNLWLADADLPELKRAPIVQMMHHVYECLPEVPEGYEGWLYKS